MMKCSEADAFSTAFVDGELAGVDRDAYETHLLRCESCSHASRFQARFKAAVRGHLSPMKVPQQLRLRIEGVLAANPPVSRRWPWLSFPRLAPAVAAMTALGALLFVVRARPPAVVAQARRTLHSSIPLDVVDKSCRIVADWFRGKLDFPVSLDFLRGRDQAQGTAPVRSVDCQGGRVVNVNERFAAYLVVIGPNGRPVGVMIYPDGEDDSLPNTLRRALRSDDLYVVTERGATTAAFRGHDGLNYVMTADGDLNDLSQLVGGRGADFRPIRP